MCLATYGSGAFGEPQHVGTQSVLGASAAFIGGKCAIGINFAFEATQERLAAGLGPRASITCAAPGDFGGDSLVYVFHWRAITSLAH